MLKLLFEYVVVIGVCSYELVECVLLDLFGVCVIDVVEVVCNGLCVVMVDVIC